MATAWTSLASSDGRAATLLPSYLFHFEGCEISKLDDHGEQPKRIASETMVGTYMAQIEKRQERNNTHYSPQTVPGSVSYETSFGSTYVSMAG